MLMIVLINHANQIEGKKHCVPSSMLGNPPVGRRIEQVDASTS